MKHTGGGHFVVVAVLTSGSPGCGSVQLTFGRLGVDWVINCILVRTYEVHTYVPRTSRVLLRPCRTSPYYDVVSRALLSVCTAVLESPLSIINFPLSSLKRMPLAVG